MAFNAPGQRQGLITSMPGFPSLSNNNRPPIQQSSPAPGSLLSTVPGLNNRSGVGMLGNFSSIANGLPVGHMPSSHQAPQQTNEEEASLDPSEFPALGAGPPSSNNPANGTLSYASHVNIPSTNGLPGDRSIASTLAGQRTDFTPDDFPALDATINQQQQQQQQQPIIGPEGNNTREAREQASAAAALTTQIARHNAHLKQTGLTDSDQRTFPTKTMVDPSQAFNGAPVGSSHLSNGIGNANNHQQHGSHLSHPPGTILPTNQQMHSNIRSPIPPNLQNMQLHRTNNSTLHTSNGGSNATLLHSTGSQNQSLQDPTNLDGTGGGGLDPSSQLNSSLDHPGVLDPSHHPNQNSSNSAAPFFAPQTPAEQVLFGPADRFGLMGLLQIIKHADPDYSILTLGKDLTHLGLDLGSSEALYPSFMTPWSDSKQVGSQSVEPDFNLPACYHVQPQAVQGKLPHFHEETLFFIFYSQPRDLMQELAALELYKKNWRYHKELQLWLTKESGTGPMEKTPHYERGFYVFFDPIIWKRVTKEFVLQYDQLEAKPALATNPAALAQAQQISLVYTTSGPHGKHHSLGGGTGVGGSSQPNQQTTTQQQAQPQQQSVSLPIQHPQPLPAQQHRILVNNNSNNNGTSHPNMVPV